MGLSFTQTQVVMVVMEQDKADLQISGRSGNDV